MSSTCQAGGASVTVAVMPASSPRSLLQPILLVAAGLVGGILLMWWINRGGDGAPRPPLTASTAQPDKAERSGQSDSSSQSDHAATPRDPFSVLNDALTTANRDARAEALHHLAERLVEEDPMKALEVGNRIPDANDKLEFMRALFAAWAGKDPRKAVDYLKANFKPGLLQSETLDAALEKWAGAHSQDAWKWLDENISGPLKEQGMAALVTGWTRNDPQGAAKWFVSTGSTSQTVLDSLVTTWADLDPRSAAAWIETLTNEENKIVGRVTLASEWVGQDPAAAAEYFTPMIDSGRQGLDLASALVNAWGAADPTSAAKWIDQLPPGSARREAAGVLATIWTANDIHAAIAWTQKLEVSEMKASAIDHIGTTWGAIEPRKALAWLDTLPSDSTRTEATRGALDSWAGTDPAAMKAWIAAQPASVTNDLARVSLGEVYADSDPAAAMQMALGITEHDQRGDSVAKFFHHWRKTDDAAAQQWLQTNWGSLAPDLQARISKEQARRLPPK